MASPSENPDIVAGNTLKVSGILSSLSSLHDRVSEAALSISQNPANGDQPEMGVQCEKICREFNNIRSAFTKLDRLGEEVAAGLVLVEKNVDEVLAAIREASADGSSLDRVHPKLRAVNRNILRLRIQLPLIPQVDFRSTDRDAEKGDGFCVHNDLLPLYLGEKYEYSSVLGGIFEGLDDPTWRQLLIFAVFPVGSVVNKRVLKNWWDGEGLLELSAEKTAEGLFEELIVRCLVEAVREGCRLIGFKMRPFVHFAVVARAMEEGFFAFGPDGNPTVQLSRSGRGCLVKTKEGPSSLDKLKQAPDSELEGLRTLFNVTEPYPDFKLEFFLKLRGLKVLSLGKWQRSSSDHHIEVDGTEFLNGLKRMRDLRLFSLRGVSRVSEIPDAVCNLGNLRILDLNSCHNLEVLPNGIGSLKKLIYLDISECYLLDSMPKELALLTELQVLKGFLVIDSAFRESCSFTDLAGLKKLRKLSVNANRKDFPREDELRTFLRFEQLKKLRISWGGRSILGKTESQSAVDPGTAASSPIAEPREAGAIRDQNETNDALESEQYIVACDEDSVRTREIVDASEIVEKGSATKEEEVKAIKSSRTRDLDGQRSYVTVKAEDITSLGVAGHVIKQEGQTTGRSKKAKATNKRMKKILSKLPTFKQQAEAELMSQEVFKALQKLDLQCYPIGSTPEWLRPQNMKSLKKLYVRGGKLRSFVEPQDTDHSWSVEIVRLKFLDDLEMKWDGMQALFPRLVYLEKFECRKLKSFPCNSSGVWVKRSEDCNSS